MRYTLGVVNIFPNQKEEEDGIRSARSPSPPPPTTTTTNPHHHHPDYLQETVN